MRSWSRVYLREALIRLNPEIAAQPDRAEDVLYKLRAIIMGVRSDGLVKANEEFAAWLTGERSMPFGEKGEHVTVRLIDFDDIEQNQYVVTTQYTFRAGATEKRADLVLLVNGIPLVVIEAKTPVRSSQSWLDGAVQVHDDYERNVPELFVPNVFSVATEGKEFRYGSIGLPVDMWGPWRIEADSETPALEQVEKAVSSMLRPQTVARPARQLHRLRYRQEEAPHQDHRSLPAVRGRQQDRRTRRCRPSQEGPHLALPGLGQVAADALCCSQAAPPSGAQEPDRDDRGRPHRPRLADLRHFLRRRHPEPGEGRQPHGAAATARAGRAQDHHHDDLQVR